MKDNREREHEELGLRYLILRDCENAQISEPMLQVFDKRFQKWVFVSTVIIDINNKEN